MASRSKTLSLATVRRIALAANGFADRAPSGSVGMRTLSRVLGRIALLQIDSVNVLIRAHYLPLFSRVGAYPRELLERAAYHRPRRLFEYWAHEASLVPVTTQPYLRWRMADAVNSAWGGLRRFATEQPGLIDQVRILITEHGPASAGEIERQLHDEPQRRGGSWWDWKNSKKALEWLLWSGEVTTAHRRGFERVYDLTDRVIDPQILALPTPEPEAAHRYLLRLAARALGVATEADLRDYFRLTPLQSRPALAALVEDGVLLPVTVQGWRQPAYLDAEARIPRRVEASALLSPFDSLIWFRARVERLWSFRYRLEIYTPAHRRIHGYYVLPFLLGDSLVARVDLKADRQAGVLRVQAAHAEPGSDTDEVADALAERLAGLAQWLGLSGVWVSPAGELAPRLRGAAALR